MNLGENPTLTEEVESDNELKTWLVNYVGDKTESGDGQVTVENIVATMAEDFPEFLMVVAEENWIRGYHQAMVDLDESKKALEQAAAENSITDEEWVKEYKENKNCNNCDSCECDEKDE